MVKESKKKREVDCKVASKKTGAALLQTVAYPRPLGSKVAYSSGMQTFLSTLNRENTLAKFKHEFNPECNERAEVKEKNSRAMRL